MPRLELASCSLPLDLLASVKETFGILGFGIVVMQSPNAQHFREVEKKKMAYLFPCYGTSTLM